jgi:two-component system cell cycle sensor histidine kinase/response regulator CckA
MLDPSSEIPLHLRTALEASGEVIFMTDRSGIFSYVNPEFVRVYGYTAAEVVGVHTPRILKGGATPPDDYAAFWRRLATHEVVWREFVNRTKTGELVHVESSANPVVSDGTCVGYLAVQRDITRRKATETALRESEARYRTLAEAAHDLIFIVDRESHIVYANTASLEPFGKRSEEVLGRKLHDVFPAATAAQMLSELAGVFDTGERQRFETRFDTLHGELWLETWLVPMPNAGAGPVAVMGVSRDFTGRKQLEQRFLHAQKMEAIGRLAGGIAHDFNNLLTAILGYSDLVLDRVRDDVSLVADVEEIKKAGDCAARLTRQLLAFSRQQVLEPQVLDLNILVADVQKMLGRVIGEDVSLEVVAVPNLERVKVDPGQVEQIILNLAVNARDAMPLGGRIRLATANAIVDEDLARRHDGAMPGRYVSLAVADTGCGMSPEVLAHVCEPFFTTKPPGKGTGLGLATVFGVVQQSGGFLTIASALGAGTTVTTYLPVAVDVPDNGRTPAPRGSGNGNETILLVEDEPGVRQLMQRTLEGRGYSVLAPASTSDAVTLAESSAGEIDLLLSDVVMPEMSGPALAQRIVLLRPGIRVLFVSGFPNRDGFETDLISGKAAFLAKPFTPLALALKVRECLAPARDREHSAGRKSLGYRATGDVFPVAAE